MAIDTGHGATLTFGTQGGSYSITNIGGHEETRPVVDTSHLGTTTNRTSMPGDLAELPAFTVSFFFDGTTGCPTFAVAETVTVTHPLAAGGSTAANIAGTAYVIRRKHPDLTTNEMQVGEVDIVWDGGTGPTLTVAT